MDNIKIGETHIAKIEKKLTLIVRIEKYTKKDTYPYEGEVVKLIKGDPEVLKSYVNRKNKIAFLEEELFPCTELGLVLYG